MNSLRNKKLLIAFGKHLKKIRESKNISQQKLALAADTYQSTIIRIEQGKTNPTLSTLFAIAKTLSIPLSELFQYFQFNENNSYTKGSPESEIHKPMLKIIFSAMFQVLKSVQPLRHEKFSDPRGNKITGIKTPPL